MIKRRSLLTIRVLLKHFLGRVEEADFGVVGETVQLKHPLAKEISRVHVCPEMEIG